MARTFLFTLTQAGLDALVDAQQGVTAPIRIAQIGLSSQDVAVSPTLEALPGEFKRIDTISGQSASETVIHMTATDYSEDVYEVRAVGLFLDDGTLFAVYNHAASALFRKVDIAMFLMAFDIVFSEAVGSDIQFGDASFLYPPATEVTKGVAELATQPEVDLGADDERIVTALKLAVRLIPILQSLDGLQNELNAEETARADADAVMQQLLTALTNRTIAGAGLVTGGGDLSANRVLTVTAATVAEALAGTRNDVALTPAALGPFKSSFAQTDWVRLPGGLTIQWGRFTAIANGSTSVIFPLAFPTACCSVVAGGTSRIDEASQDNPPAVITSSISATGFSVFASDNEASGCAYIAVGY